MAETPVVETAMALVIIVSGVMVVISTVLIILVAFIIDCCEPRECSLK